ncbi:hypothetical protein FACS189462_5020 [Spirochaetia bacterium]|nr:hypothetical protein FACS189462_5020 [Spirochaetia bacterium]
MEAVRAYYDGRVFTPEEPVKLAKNTTVILSFQADGRNAENPFRITAEEKRVRDAAESEYLNANAERMNAEMADVLQYQKDIFPISLT